MRQNIFKKFGVLISIAALSLSLVGCSSDPASDSAIAPAPSDAGSSEQSPSDAGGEINEADDLIPESVKAIKAPNKDDYPGWDQPGINGAEPLTSLFIDAFLYGYSTGDTSLIEELYDPEECEVCKVHVEVANKSKARNEYFDHGLPKEVHSVDLYDFDEETKTFIMLQRFTLPAHKKYLNGEVIKEYGEKNFDFYLYLHNPGDGWIIRYFVYDFEDVDS